MVPHGIGVVLRVGNDVVGLDGGNGEGTLGTRVVLAQARQFGFQVLDVGAVDTDKHHEQSLFVAPAAGRSHIRAWGKKAVARNAAIAEDINEFKGRGNRPQLHHL